MSTLSVVIVTLDRKDELCRLLQDLMALRRDEELEVIVIDNGSRDGTAQQVRERFPAINLLQLEENRGAPAARNVGAAAARGEILVFLDDDARVEDPSFLRRVRRPFEESSATGVVAFQILDPVTRRPRCFEIPCRKKERYREPFETSYFISAGCAIRRRVYEETGGMDESLFYGFEELDFSYRAVSHGFRIFYRPEVSILHGLSGAGRPTSRRVFYFLRNKIWISARYLPWRMFTVQLIVWSAYFLAESIQIGRPDKFMAALWHGLAGVPGRLRLRTHDRLAEETLARLKGIEGRLYI